MSGNDWLNRYVFSLWQKSDKEDDITGNRICVAYNVIVRYFSSFGFIDLHPVKCFAVVMFSSVGLSAKLLPAKTTALDKTFTVSGAQGSDADSI